MNHSKIVAIAAMVFFALSCKSAQKEKGADTSSPEGTKIIKEYWDDKSLKGQGPAKGKEKQGRWTLYHKTSGEKLGEGEYLNNKQHGMWTFYYKNGQKSNEGEMIEEQRTGEWKGYHETGELMWKANYVIKEKTESGFTMMIGGMEGVKTSFFKSGKVWKEEEFRDGVKNGRSQEYYEDGKPKEIAWFKNNQKDGQATEWYPSGKKRMEGANAADEKTGKWRFYHDNGQMAADASFIKNKPEGAWRFFSREGKLMKDGSYKEGKEIGLWNFYDGSGRKYMELALLGGMVTGGGNRLYENGALAGEGVLIGIPKAVFDVLKDGKAAGTMEAADPPADDAKNNTSFRWSGKWMPLKKNGKWTEFFPGGKTAKIEGTYMMDKLNGPYKEYYPSGKIKAEGEYMTGKKNGEWKFYLQNGALDTDNSGRYMLDKKSKF